MLFLPKLFDLFIWRVGRINRQKGENNGENLGDVSEAL